ncbi:MAG: GNAT family N-acetyltransferase, partial [Brachybacterium sp.]|nr:GNAT family N-acetyltransferase [Brachybacterium sp.]
MSRFPDGHRDAVHIRPATAADRDAVLAIRTAAIRTSTSLWIDTVPAPEEHAAWFDGRVASGALIVAAVTAPDRPAPSADGAGEDVLGFASFGPLRPYDGYRYTAEDTVHLRHDALGRGIGRALLEALIVRARDAGMHSMIGMIEASNAASIGLHERVGFQQVGRIPQAG